MPATISLTDNIPAVRRALQDDEKQARYAAVRGLDRTGRHAQQQHVQHLLTSGEFTIRREQFARRADKITKFPNRREQNPALVLEVQPPGGIQRADVWGQHEDGGEKKPVDGRRLMIPADDVKRGKSGVVSDAMRPKALAFKPMGRATNVLQGAKRTFMIRNADGTGAIYQRTGKKATKRKAGDGRRLVSDVETRRTRDVTIRKLYGATPRAKLLRKLGFHEVTEKAARERLEADFLEAYDQAMRTRR